MTRNRLLLGLGLLSLGTFSCSRESPPPAPTAAAPAAPEPAAAPEPPKPTMGYEKIVSFFRLPAAAKAAARPADTAEQVTLGHKLFFEKRLSKNHDISCNSCHDLATFGVDGKATSEGHKGQKGSRNAPTVFHAAGHVAQFWDGRAATLEEQA